MKVLVIESDSETALSLKKILEEFFVVDIASCPQEGEYLALFDCFDLIILDGKLHERLKNENIHTSFLVPEKPLVIDKLITSIRPSGILTAADIAIDLNAMTVARNGERIALRRKEFLILEYLVRNAGQAVSRQTLLDRVWKTYEEAGSNIVDVHVKYLRDKIDRPFQRKLIKTVYGVGYKIDG